LEAEKAIKAAISKYGIDNFEKEIIAQATSRENLWLLEQQIVNSAVVNDPLSYNMAYGGVSYLDGLKKYDYQKFIEHQSAAGKIGGKISISKRDSEWHAKGARASREKRILNNTLSGYNMKPQAKDNIRQGRLNGSRYRCTLCDSEKLFDGGNFHKHLTHQHSLDKDDISKYKLTCRQWRASAKVEA